MDNSKLEDLPTDDPLEENDEEDTNGEKILYEG